MAGRAKDGHPLRAIGRVLSPNVAKLAWVLLIEGIGGIMVPLDERHTVLDWCRSCASRSFWSREAMSARISHTLTALEVLARRNLDIAAVTV